MTMTTKQFKEAREALCYSQNALADEWEMGRHGERTIRRWETGKMPIPSTVAYCLRLMMQVEGLLEDDDRDNLQK